jgi:hypothetical protein
MKKEHVLVGLLMVAGLSWFFVYRDATVRAPQPKGRTKVTAPQSIPDARIRLGLLDHAAHLGAAGESNIFRYREKPMQLSAVAQASAPPVQNLTNRTTDVAQPPTPSFGKAWKYEGFTRSGDNLVASLTEGNTTYPVVTLGDCLMGQYCVRSLAENVIEIEDLQLQQRRSFPRVQ